MWNFKSSIFLASIAVCSSLTFVRRENPPDCEIDKVKSESPIVLKFTGDNVPTLFGDFSSFPTDWICQNGKFLMKFVNGVAIRYTLETLHLPHNNVTAKGLQLLALPQNLRRINASHNSIEHISIDTFPTPNNLHFLDLSFNNITELPTNAFQRLNEMLELSLANNRISSLSARLFHPMDGLKELDLSHNEIDQIDSNAFSLTCDLKVLNLSHNKLNSMEILPRLHHLQRLNLAHNQIITFFSSMHLSLCLVELDLSFNKIEKIVNGGLFANFDLTRLDLSGNQISKLTSDMFRDLRGLKHLKLRQNALSEIEFGSFEELEQLETLDVSQNRLTTFDLKMYRTNAINFSFKTLDISNNSLVELANFASESIPNAVISGINSNQINCTHFKQFFRKLTFNYSDARTMMDTCGMDSNVLAEIKPVGPGVVNMFIDDDIDDESDEGNFSPIITSIPSRPIAPASLPSHTFVPHPVVRIPFGPPQHELDSFEPGLFVPPPFAPASFPPPTFEPPPFPLPGRRIAIDSHHMHPIPMRPIPIPLHEIPSMPRTPCQLNRLIRLPLGPFPMPLNQMPPVPPSPFPIPLDCIHPGPIPILIPPPSPAPVPTPTTIDQSDKKPTPPRPNPSHLSQTQAPPNTVQRRDLRIENHLKALTWFVGIGFAVIVVLLGVLLKMFWNGKTQNNYIYPNQPIKPKSVENEYQI